MPSLLTLRENELIDAESEFHYAYHRSLQTVTGLHNHDFYEIFLVTKGAFRHSVNGANVVLDEGALVFIRPGDLHGYEAVAGRPGELLNLAFPERTLLALLDYLGPGFEREKLLQEPLPPVITLRKPQIDMLIGRFQELTLIPALQKQRLKAEARSLLADLAMRYFSGAEPISGLDEMPPWLDRLLRDMHKKENFTAGLCRMHELSPKSPEHLSRTMKKHAGVTPTQWINETRLQYAANLLTYTDESVLAVCLDSGFENLSHFNHQFKRLYRLSPTRYRKRNQKSAIPE